MERGELPRGTVTFLFTDIERSTELTRQLGADYSRVRRDHHRLLRECFVRHDGYEIDTAGDGFFVAFERAGDAVTAAVDAQRALHATLGAGQLPVRVRMGVHTAEPHLDDDGYVGVGVSRAARICGAAHGGQILLSNATAGIVDDLQLDGISIDDLGDHELKDLSRPQRLFQVVVDGLPSEFPPPKSLDPVRQRSSVVTLLFTDVDGWREILRTYGDEKGVASARAYQALVRQVVAAEGGDAAEATGDQVLGVFERPQDAVRCAVRLRERLRVEPWFPTSEPPTVSMAVHSGFLADPSGEQLGLVAFHCQMLSRAAADGQVLVSQATRALLAGTLLDAGLRDLGERAIAGFDEPVHVFEIPD